MKTSLLLRISSIVSVLFAAGHALGGRKSWSPMGENAVLDAMRTQRFDVMGVSRSYLDFYRGFGFSVSVSMLLQAVLLWQIASLARSEPRRLAPMIAAFFLSSLAGAAISWLFIFPLPTFFSVALTVCLGAALFAAWAGR
jgi:hypothetical protein